jgi:hypothetical protein
LSATAVSTELSPTVLASGASTWRAEALTKIRELNGQLAWMGGDHELREVALEHLNQARASATIPHPPWWRVLTRLRSGLGGVAFERTLGNLDAAEADILRLAPDAFFMGYVPSLRAQVHRYLAKDDPRRLQVDRLGRGAVAPADREYLINAYHAANTQRRRDLMRLRSFRNLVWGGTATLALVACVLALLSSLHPTWVPLCFNPVEKHQVVCATQVVAAPGAPENLDAYVARAARPHDVILVEILGVIAAAVAGAATMRRIRGTATPFGIAVALAVLKLPIGALTAVLGLLLMAGGFVPGLSALDSSAQIVAWAIIFGYAQQLFTRLIDDQGSGLLSRVGGRGPAGDREPPDVD